MSALVISKNNPPPGRKLFEVMICLDIGTPGRGPAGQNRGRVTSSRAIGDNSEVMGTTTEPVYLRVLEDIRSRISTGALQPGARVPSRNAIITNYGVGETAAKHALQVLVAEGLIEARPGSGCYVRRAPDAGVLEHDRPH